MYCQYVCSLGIEPTTFVLLMQCSTTEPQEHQFIKVSRLMFANSNLQFTPQIFYGIKVWRLAWQLQNLNVLLLKPLLCCLGRVFWVIGMLDYPARPIFNALALTVYGLSIVLLMRCSCPVPLAEKHPQSIMFPPPCLTWGWCSWGHRQHSSSSNHGEFSWCLRARFWSHPTTKLSLSSPLNHSDVHWQIQMGLYMCFLEQGTLRVLQDFSPSQLSVLPIVFLVTMVPAALRSLTRSSRVVLGWFHTVFMIN